ncbi:alpha-galactosidase [Cohaesibacter sp. CAU 1516]|uniref:alpha-galactosidase n=1 Tax=Cohaesibacter sp. CAU 1516 TaxID=2576038 RepID=UPI0010FD1455|nr:alpha-galactosidase [Cohaesibacter sp. CAU 1516]TLP48566.1 alpha-galactosidase [Cohaesibacter sp. CAU 1516]
MKRCWRLDDDRQSLVLVSRNDQLAEVAYWGRRLPDDEDLEGLYQAQGMDVTGGMLDEVPALSICPETSQTFPGQPGMMVRAADGHLLAPRLRFVAANDSEEGALSLTFADEALGLTYIASFAIDAGTKMIVARASLSSGAPILVDWLAAPVLPGPQLSDEMIDFSGRWCGEFMTNRVAWTPGAHLRDNRTGRSGHEHFPGLIVPLTGAINSSGEAFGFHYGWSGGHRLVAEELPDGRRQIQFGNAGGSFRAPVTQVETAPLYVTYSDEGLNGLAVSFQRHLRDRVLTMPHPDRPRPVHYNCWEAIYFDHDVEALKQIAERAAALGAERFVLDDGWFGRRDDDTSSLGDWVIDRRKFPDGLTPLIDHVQGLGMRFGIWFEPEMVNKESDLYRAHPDWMLGDADQLAGRQQFVLDLANDAVCNYLYDKIAAVLSDNDIDYIKWDHNRVLPYPDADQTAGIYDLLGRLRADFPSVEIESCSSGGGRIDFGILGHTQRVWLSDSNDALERMRIQHEAALFLPLVVTGSHVGPRHCHTSGRDLDIHLWAWVAAQRHMGFEMDPRELSADEAALLTRVTSWWKANRGWMEKADILRLDHGDKAIFAEQQLAADGGRFVVFAGKAGTSRQILPRPLRLTGLEPEAHYRLTLLDADRGVHLSRGLPALKQGPIKASGAFLMQHGVTLPWSFPDVMWVLEGQRL